MFEFLKCIQITDLFLFLNFIQNAVIQSYISCSFVYSLYGFGYLGSFLVLYKFQDYLFQFCEKCHWYYDSNCIDSVFCFGKYGLFKDVLSIHEHNVYFHLLCSSVSFFNFLQFLSTGLSPFWLNLVLGILFSDKIVNGIVFLIYLSDCSFLVYKNATKF